ncbi:hypothetical protein ACQPZA_30890 [Pseudonocardia xinjiangensis]|uniref:hypothetical protein n=1 Tax=Pseudonocardia xinjiangensis TaxID=75289 RepID=UPI003D8EFD49
MSRSHQPERLTRLACHGQCRPDPARHVHHDQLLRVESDPDAMVDLFETAVTWAELEYPTDTTIAPHEWLDFAQRHRWHDPERMLRIFGLATDIALRAAPAPAPAALGMAMAAGSGICPALDPVEPPRRRLRVAGP